MVVPPPPPPPPPPSDLQTFVDDVGKPISPMLAVLLFRAGLNGVQAFRLGRMFPAEPNPFSPLPVRQQWARQFLGVMDNFRSTTLGQATALTFDGGLMIGNQMNTNRILRDAQPLLDSLNTGDKVSQWGTRWELWRKQTEALWGTCSLSLIVLIADLLSTSATGNGWLDGFNILSSLGIAGGMLGTTIPQILDKIPYDIADNKYKP